MSVPYPIITVDGQGWITYYDGKHKAKVPEELLDRPVTNIYQRKGREEEVSGGRPACCELKAGLAIILEGAEDGDI